MNVEVCCEISEQRRNTRRRKGVKCECPLSFDIVDDINLQGHDYRLRYNRLLFLSGPRNSMAVPSCYNHRHIVLQLKRSFLFCYRSRKYNYHS